MSQYLVMIYGDEASWAALSSDEVAEHVGEHEAFFAADSSAVRGGNELHPTSMARSSRTDAAGKVTVTDGPFAETKEAIGGYYLIEAADLDAAVEIAQQVPTVTGGVEMRPVKSAG